MVKVNQLASNFFDTIDLPLNMTEEDEKHFNETDICWLCEGEIISRAPYSCDSDFCFDRCGRSKDHEEDERIREEYEKVGDHDHLTGKYIEVLHIINVI